MFCVPSCQQRCQNTANAAIKPQAASSSAVPTIPARSQGVMRLQASGCIPHRSIPFCPYTTTFPSYLLLLLAAVFPSSNTDGPHMLTDLRPPSCQVMPASSIILSPDRPAPPSAQFRPSFTWGDLDAESFSQAIRAAKTFSCAIGQCWLNICK